MNIECDKRSTKEFSGTRGNSSHEPLQGPNELRIRVADFFCGRQHTGLEDCNGPGMALPQCVTALYQLHVHLIDYMFEIVVAFWLISCQLNENLVSSSDLTKISVFLLICLIRLTEFFESASIPFRMANPCEIKLLGCILVRFIIYFSMFNIISSALLLYLPGRVSVKRANVSRACARLDRMASLTPCIFAFACPRISPESASMSIRDNSVM